MSDSQGAVSLFRILKVLLPVALIAIAVRYTLVPNYEKAAQEKFETNMLNSLLGDDPVTPGERIEFTDTDGDLVADAPADRAAPERLVFSYIATTEDAEESATWSDVVDALAESTGLPVDYRHFTSTNDQLAAMARGELHVAGLNTGSVPMGVEYAGFVPVCVLGKEDGSFGYTMKIIAAPNGPVSTVEQIAGNKIVFTRPDSNSGFKAALALLLSEHDLKPERDYRWGFSFAHETSIRETAAGEHDAAAVASDILERMTNDGEVGADAYDVVYESERFPPATLGHAHNLTDELKAKIAETLLGFDWSGTGVEEKYGSAGLARFVAVNFKDDWANVRRIDEAVSKAKASQGK